MNTTQRIPGATTTLLVVAAMMMNSTGADERPNILVMMVDDMGYSDLGCYGSEIKTPNLDKLASGGIRYTQMYNTAKCWTTRISLMTGLYHHRSGRDFEHTAMAGEVLRPAGYKTWWSGKHHADFNPHDRGFDHFSGFLGGAINFWNPGDVAREGEADPGWKAVYTWAFDDKLVKPFVPEKGFYATDDFTDWSLEWLEEAKAGKGGIDDPFFLYVAYNAPHWPLHAHPEDIAKYEGVYDGGYAAIRNARYKRQVEMGLYDPDAAPLSEPEADLVWDALSDAEKAIEAKHMEMHAAMVDRVDQNVGRHVGRLEELGELENTLILFLVDNGASAESPNRKGAPQEPWGSVGTFESIGKKWAVVADTPFRFWKTTSYEGGICTPMIAHWPEGIAKEMEGQFYREPCHLIDFLPTWMELAEAGAHYPGESKQEAIPALDGISIAPSFTGKSLKREKPLFFQYGSGKAVRDGDWKLVRGGGSPWELHDVKSGRTEAADVSAEHPKRVAAMELAWNEWFRDCTGKAFVEKAKKPKTPKKGKATTKEKKGADAKGGKAEMHNVLTKKEKADGWQLLFDGKTLEGWMSSKTRAPLESDQWSVVDGALTLKGKGGGDIFTAKGFENYEYEIEWKTMGNSGLFFRVDPAYKDKTWHRAMEMQVIKDDPASKKSTSAGGIYSLYEFAGEKTFHPDWWNKVRVRCVEDRFMVWFNGKKSFDFTIGSDDWNARVAKSKFGKYEGFCALKSGRFGLQDHGKSVQFRNIKVRELGGAAGEATSD